VSTTPRVNLQSSSAVGFLQSAGSPARQGKPRNRIEDTHLSRRAHPYFGQIDRLAPLPPADPARRRTREPAMTPDELPGVLWDAVRGGSV